MVEQNQRSNMHSHEVQIKGNIPYLNSRQVYWIESEALNCFQQLYSFQFVFRLCKLHVCLSLVLESVKFFRLSNAHF